MCTCTLNLQTSLVWVTSESSLTVAAQDKWLIMELI